jgi:hypothetical protein
VVICILYRKNSETATIELNMCMNNLLVCITVFLSGCSTVTAWIPSFWDHNQSARVIDVRVKVIAIDCAQPQPAQILPIQQDLTWFMEYSRAKGFLQQDVIRVVLPMQEIVARWVLRGDGSLAYCELNKLLLTQTSERAAKAVLGRY